MPQMHFKYRFASCSDQDNISNVSTDHKVLLSHLIGESLSSLIRNPLCPLELLRLNRGSSFIVVRRRFNDIVCEIYECAL